MTQSKTNIAIDGNEANTNDRVGSNVYAFEILTALYEQTQTNPQLNFTILLSAQPLLDLPLPRPGWQYQVIGPKLMWSQFAEPIHLFLNAKKFELLFVPGHYAPLISAVPYISSVMDLAYLEYPDQFEQKDLLKLKRWTKYSVRDARKVIAISEFTKQDVIKHYQKPASDIVVAYPAISKTKPAPDKTAQKFLKDHQIEQPFFLFLGTIQPRKNIIRLVEAYEKLCRRLSSQELNRKTKHQPLPQLVLAGKIGWLADPILERIQESSFMENIILVGYVPDEIKPHLYKQAVASLLLGLYEGFGIPPLESLHYNCLPIVADTTSLPEVVGPAGLQVNPYQIKEIAAAMEKALQLSQKKRATYKRKAKVQMKKFSWQKSAQTILNTIQEVIHEQSR